MKTLTRRTFLASAPASVAGLLPASAIASTAPADTPEQELEDAIAALQAAMARIHGEVCRIERSGNSMISIMAPHRPDSFEFEGSGKYEVEIGGLRAVMWIKRAPDHDSKRFGRCFYAVPKPADLIRRYYFEDDLKAVLIRKL